MRTRVGFKSLVIVAIPVLAAGIVVGASVKSLGNVSSSAASSQNYQIEKPNATAQINRTFDFPLKSSDGSTSSFGYTIVDAQLQKQIIVKGTRATAVDGRIFLIINIKLVNSRNQGLSVNTRDYLRLSVNGTTELLAPEIHNDPVEVQAISTQYARVGFPVNESDRAFVLHAGEINGKKQNIALIFKN